LAEVIEKYESGLLGIKVFNMCLGGGRCFVHFSPWTLHIVQRCTQAHHSPTNILL